MCNIHDVCCSMYCGGVVTWCLLDFVNYASMNASVLSTLMNMIGEHPFAAPMTLHAAHFEKKQMAGHTLAVRARLRACTCMRICVHACQCNG